MNIFNETLLPKLRRVLDEMRGTQVHFMTWEVISKYLNRPYYEDKCAAAYSFNANFGKFMKQHEIDLRIRETKSNIHFEDGLGNKTKCSKWRFIN